MDGIQTGFNLVVIKPTTGAETCFSFFFFEVGLCMVTPGIGTMHLS